MKLTLFLTLFSLVSCEVLTKKEPNKSQKTDRACACLPTTNLTINSAQTLPEKIALKVNNRPLIDECKPSPSEADDIKIIREEKSGIIQVKLGYMNSNANLEIIDLGSDCTNDAIFYSNDAVPVQIRVISDRRDLPGLYEAVIDI